MEYKKYLNKNDLQGESVYGLDAYHPGEESVKGMFLITTSGSTGNPLLMARESPPEKLKDMRMGAEERYLYISPRRQHGLILAQTHMQYEQNKYSCYLSKQEFDSLDPLWLFEELQPKEISGNPTSYFETVLAVAKDSPASLASVKEFVIGNGVFPSEIAEKLIRALPQTQLRFRYNNTETCPGTIGMSCPHIIEKYYLSVPGGCSPIHTPYEVEILDQDEEGWGEIVVTTYHIQNYRTGDWGKYFTEPCPCGKSKTLLVRGRYNLDSVLCCGAALYTEEVLRLQKKFAHLIKEMRVEVREMFEPHLYGTVHFRILPTAILRSQKNGSRLIGEQLAREFAVTKTKSLADLVADGIFDTPTVELFDSFPDGEKSIPLKKLQY